MAQNEYRAMCFNVPIGPWRRTLALARKDLFERDLGAYDERGAFYITVPGDIQWAAVVGQSNAA